jgi:beta-N-acetylhexosaminidase
MATPETAIKALGQLFIMGFSGLELSDDTAAFISQANIGGVLLFSPNYESPGQVAELINQIQECRRDLPLWISVDHEGGKVQRFKKSFTKIPEAATIAATDSPRLAFEIAEMMAKELSSVGINLNFAPVADIATNPKNPIIGNRAFGDNEDQVSKMSSAMVRGHLVHGVQPCVKHFPGHGDTNTDSHLALPRVDTELDVLVEREFKPFIKAFKSRCSMVMTAHILNPKLDPKYPATLSKLILRDILRKQLRYTRIIISDDMEMKAITDHYGAEDAPRLALEAGCDMLIYRSEAAARHAYASLVKDIESGKISPEIILEAEARTSALKRDTLLPYKEINISELSQKIGIPAHLELIKRVDEPRPQA